MKINLYDFTYFIFSKLLNIWRLLHLLMAFVFLTELIRNYPFKSVTFIGIIRPIVKVIP